MIQILCIVLGLYALVKGEISVSSESKVVGTPARVVGGGLVAAGIAVTFGEPGMIAGMIILVASIGFAFVKRS